MAELNHTIVPARDPLTSAQFLADILGLPVDPPVAHFTLWVPGTLSTSCDQAVFVDQASDAGLSSCAVPVEIDRFG